MKDIIGDSLHPGELGLTKRVIEIARISKGKVLDIACGLGTSARFIIENYICDVVGIDLSAKLIKMAKKGVAKEPFTGRAEFVIGDAEFLPYIDSCFDVVICESGLSLFSDKSKALREIYRILKSGGRFVATNMVLKRDIPAELRNTLTFALCIAGAETLERFHKLFEQAGFADIYIEDHTEKLLALGLKLLLSDSLAETSSLSILKLSLKKIFEKDILGYALIAASKQ